MAVTVVTVPLYIHQIGEARYGVLAIVWLLLGYFGLFDLGLGRATAQAIAANLNEGKEKQNDIVWAAVLANIVFGCIGGVILWGVGWWALGGAIPMADQWRHELLNVLPWVAASVPVATVTSIFSGTLTGRSSFLALNVLSVIGTALFQVIPVCAAYAFGPNLHVVIPAAVLARILSSIPFAFACWHGASLGWWRSSCLGEIVPLVRFGLWVSGANVIAPLLTNIDRFVIAAIAGAKAVTYYVVPMGLADKLKIVPGGLAGALFPRYATAADDEEVRKNTEDMFVLASLLVVPVACIGIAVFPAFLTLWINHPFSLHAALTGQILLVGVWVNSSAQIPFVRLQAMGRPDLAVKYYLIEVVPYIFCLWGGIVLFGVAGAAAAWGLRAGADMLLLAHGARIRRAAMLSQLPGLAILIGAILVSRLSLGAVVAIVAQIALVALATYFGWRQLSGEMRRAVVKKLAAFRCFALTRKV